MYLITITQQIFAELMTHKLRSSLAIFCIAFGALAIVVLLALGTGFCEASKNLFSITSGTFAVGMGRTEKSYGGYSKGRFNSLMYADVMELPRIFPSIAMVSPQRMKTASISYNGKAYTKRVIATAPEVRQLEKIKLTTGSRFINQIDVKNNARVAILGEKIKQILFGSVNALGKQFLINGVPFMVVGVIHKDTKRSHFADRVFVSNQAYMTLFDDPYINFFFVLPKPDVNPVQFEQLLRGHFARKYCFDKNDKGALRVWSSYKFFQFIKWFLVGIRLFLGFCGAMILVVGSIGVANIMFLIVTERTYEIGLRKAIGATDRQILEQLLFEALMIIGIGGGLGISVAIMIVKLLQKITLPAWLGTPELSWQTMVITIIILALTGLIAGFFPAKKAARLDPIEALTL